MTGESPRHVEDIPQPGGEAAGITWETFDERLSTYDQRWTGSHDKTDMARAGFTFTGEKDKVECSECGLRLLNWTASDDPLHQHASRRPLCPFITRTYTQLDRVKPPKHPQYQHLKNRLDSFVAWPGRYVPKTPEELAASGFYYIGSADRVTCFQCGITLRDWEQDHDPVEEHRRYSPNCDFINRQDVNQLGVSTRTSTSEEVPRGGPSNDVETGTSCAFAHASENETEIKQTEAKDSPLTNTDVTPVSVSQNEDVAKSDEEQTESCERFHDSKTPSTASTISRQQLKAENQRLKQRRTCRVCQKEPVSILFLPCGHLVTCSKCAPRVDECVVCHKKILGTVRTFLT